MVFYFSGTGNSKYVATKIADGLNDKVISINALIKSDTKMPIDVDGNLVIVAPSYYFRMPHIVEDWFTAQTFKNVKKAYFIICYFSVYGDAKCYNKRLASAKGLTYAGTMPIMMPNNHITMNTPTSIDDAKVIVEQADKSIADAINLINNGKDFEDYKVNILGKLMSRTINPLLYKILISSKRFRVKDTCINCSKCVDVCPLGNIKIANGKPIWGDNCTHCLACISYCPKEAIEYKKTSIGKSRYTIEKVLETNK